MAILAAIILNKSGEILLLRKYVEASRDVIEAYVREFMSLMEQQARTFTGGYASYGYTPIAQTLCLLIVTDRLAYVAEREDALRVLSKIVSDRSSSPDEKGICDSAFEIGFTFDEAINPEGGSTNDIVLKSNLEMCSDTWIERSILPQAEPAALLPINSVQFTVDENISVTRTLSTNEIKFSLLGTLRLKIPNGLGRIHRVQVDYENIPGPNFHQANLVRRYNLDQKSLLLEKEEIAVHDNSNVLLLNWTSKNVDLLPLLVDCLKTPTAFYIHYEALPMSNLRNVMIAVLVPRLPKSSRIKRSQGTFLRRTATMIIWSIPLIQETNKSTGSLEIHYGPEDPIPFPTITVRFDTEKTLSKLKVIYSVPANKKEPNTFSLHSKLSTQIYRVYE